MIPNPPVGRIPGIDAVRALAPDLAAAAAGVHQVWGQDPGGWDEEYGEGGICHDVASAMAGVLDAAGVEDVCTVHAGVGENHVFVVALLDDGVWAIDIPPHVYETGSGYIWRKRHDARISPEDVTFDRIAEPMSSDDFEVAYRD